MARWTTLVRKEKEQAAVHGSSDFAQAETHPTPDARSESIELLTATGVSVGSKRRVGTRHSPDARPTLEAVAITGQPLAAYDGPATAALVRRGWVAVKARHLDGEVVILALDGVPEERLPKGRRVYRVESETQHLLDLAPDELKTVHRVKTVFDGTIVASDEEPAE